MSNPQEATPSTRTAPVRDRLEASLRSALAARGLAANPYTRLRVAVALVQELERSRPLGPGEAAISRTLAARAGCSVSQAKRGLETLRAAGCLVDERGRTLLHADLAIWDCVTRDPLELDERCVRALHRVAAAAVPAIEDDTLAAEAFRLVAGREPNEAQAAPVARVPARPRPLLAGAILARLRERGLDPEPRVRVAILGELVRAVGDGAPIAVPGLITAVTGVLPVSEQQTRNVVGALLESGLLLTSEESGEVHAVRYAGVADLDGALVDLYVAAAAGVGDEEQIRHAVNAGPVSSARSPLEAAIRDLRCLVEPVARRSLLEHVADALAQSPVEGMPPGDLRRALMRRGDYSSNAANAFLAALARSGLLRTATGDTPRVVSSDARFTQLATGDLDEAEAALTAYWIEQVAARAPTVDLATIRAAFA